MTGPAATGWKSISVVPMENKVREPRPEEEARERVRQRERERDQHTERRKRERSAFGKKIERETNIHRMEEYQQGTNGEQGSETGWKSISKVPMESKVRKQRPEEEARERE